MNRRFFTITKPIKNLNMKNHLLKIQSAHSWTMALWTLVLLAVVLPFQMEAKTTKPPDVDYYTCTMHPSVRSQDPDGKCPICGMDLVPVMKKDTETSTSTSGDTNRPAAGGHKIKFYQSTMSPRETS